MTNKDSKDSGMAVASQQEPPLRPISLRDSYNNLFLIHDYLQQLCRAEPRTPEFFDMQYLVSKKMRAASSFGGRMGQASAFVLLAAYFLRGRSVGLRFVYGFLYGYWVSHFYTLGSYLGVMLKIPSVSKISDDYYRSHPNEPNKMLELRSLMYRSEPVEKLLDDAFPYRKVNNESSYTANNFYIQHGKRYFSETEELTGDGKTPRIHEQPLALKYFDSFLTRYIYHHFRRWCIRVGQWAGRIEE